jgi:Cyclic nucleotide-binding domain/Regulator of G protein signaling domain
MNTAIDSELDVTATMALAGYTKFEYFNAGVTIFKPGSNLTKMYIILQGKTKETYTAPNTGAEETVEYFPGDSFGEVCMISATPYTTTMIAEASTVLLSFDEKAYESTFYNDKAKLAEMKLRVKGSDYELSSVLYYPPALELFEAFSVKEHATESLYLWKAIDRLEELCQRVDRQLENAMNGSVRAKAVNRAATMARGFMTTSSLRRASGTPEEAIPGQAQKKPVYVKAETPEKIYETGIAQIRDVIKNIMEQYVFDGSPNQVNLPGKMRVQVEEDVKQWLEDTTPVGATQPPKSPKYDHCNPNFTVPKELFAKVKTEAYMVMRKDTYARWRFTAEFTEFINKLEPFSRRRSSLADVTTESRRASTDFSNSLLRKQSMRTVEGVDIKRLREIDDVHVHA